MDVDDDDGTQRPRQVQDYGIEVDFDNLTEEERAVCNVLTVENWNLIFPLGQFSRDRCRVRCASCETQCRDREDGTQPEGH
jgi:hypothetical protein